MEPVQEPSRPSEFEVQATLYIELKKLGYNVRGEVTVPYGFKGGRRQTCRFDLALFNDGVLSGILEVKQTQTIHKSPNGWLDTRQGARYHNFGVPVKIIYGMEEALSFLEVVEQTGTLWDQ